nr:MAG TPA: hypothetical protein [Bacteriophage sp.]
MFPTSPYYKDCIILKNEVKVKFFTIIYFIKNQLLI